MTYESILLAQNITAESVGSSFAYTDKKPGSGYHNRLDSTHTATYTVNSFVGTIKLQGTLELYPTDTDWFDIDNTEIGGDSSILGGISIDPNPSTSLENVSFNFIGNFVWIRGAYNIQNGTIVEIRYNY